MNAPLVRVGDVLRLERRQIDVDPGTEYREIGIRSFGKGIFHKEPVTGDLLGNKRVFGIEPGDLVLSNVFAWEGAVALAAESERGMIGSHRFMTYVPRDDRVLPAWAAKFFVSEHGLSLIGAASPGSAGRNRTLAIRRFEDLEIPLPPPDEQRRTARHLDSMQSLTASLGRRIAMVDDVVGSLVESWLGQEFSVMSDTRAVGEVAEVRRGRGPTYEAGSGRIAINQACVRWGRIDLGQAREVSGVWWESVPASGRVRPGDLLVNSTGEGTIGRAATVSTESIGVPFDSHVLAVSTNGDVMLPDYLAAYLRSPQGQGQITRLKGANTTKQTELGKKKLELLPVCWCEPSEQRALVAGLRVVEEKARDINARCVQRRGLRAALVPAALNEAFGVI